MEKLFPTCLKCRSEPQTKLEYNDWTLACVLIIEGKFK